MNFRYDSQKTLQAAGLLLSLADGGSMEYMRLIKLLYMADRKALDLMGETITGDRYVSMNYGPVLSHVYDLINHGPPIDPANPWFDFISAPANYRVKLIKDPGNGDLCEKEEAIIRDTFRIYRAMNIWDLSELTHLFPEWRNPHGGAIPIRIEDILRGIGKPEEEIEEIRSDMETKYYLDKLFDAEEDLTTTPTIQIEDSVEAC